MTVLGTNEKPTRPPPRKFKFTTKPRVASSQIKPTTTAASVTTKSTAVKQKWELPANKTKKEKNLKPWGKNKVLNKQETNTQMKKNTLKQKSKTQLKKTKVIKPVNGKDKLKPKTNQTAAADAKALKTSNSLKDNTAHTKKKIPPKKGAQKQINLQKNGIKVKELAKENLGFMNKTKTNLKANTTMTNKLQVKNK